MLVVPLTTQLDALRFPGTFFVEQGGSRERLYVIESSSFSGTLIYTNGKFAKEAGEPTYYFFISAKASRYGD